MCVFKMTDVSPESHAKFRAFRQLVFHCSEKLSAKELHALTYIWLYPEREKYKDATGVSVLSKLESNGQFSPWNPEGLLEVFKELKRTDLCTEVKDFMKMKRPKVMKKLPQQLVHTTDEDLQATFEVVVAQATVLMQQIEAFEKVLLQENDARARAHEVITEAAQTAKTLAERLLRAQTELYEEEVSCSEHNQYVDLTSYRSLGGVSALSDVCQQNTSLTPSQPAPTNSDLGEYVDMSSIKTSKQNRTEQNLTTCHDVPATIVGTENSVLLASSYGNSTAQPKKTPITVGLSSAAATVFPQTKAPLPTTPGIEHSLPTSSSADSSPRRALHSSCESASRQDGAQYCNLEELQGQLFKRSQAQSMESASPVALSQDSAPSTPPDALYTNISSFPTVRDIALPPRDIQRNVNVTISLPVATATPTPSERNNSLSSVEEAQGTTTPPIISPERAVEQAVVSEPTINTGCRPVIAPKPRIKPKPDVPPRRSSLSHTSHMRVRSKVTSRSNKCTSVFGTMKNSISTNQREVSLSCGPKTDSGGNLVIHAASPSNGTTENEPERKYAVVVHN